jgi:hypothetical protein
MTAKQVVTTATTEAQAYIDGWHACMNGEDGRFTNPHPFRTDTNYAWSAGFLDAMEAEDDEEPEPWCAGFGGEPN